MNEPGNKALLPTGMRDVLPGDAAFEASATERLMASFEGWGYDRISPPLIEFEESLLTGSGAATASHTFRLMDPLSQRMMGLRPDITMQAARIATTRLRHAPRPLRLGYAGQVLRIKGSQLRPERQFTQVGAELIGSSASSADTEVILMALDALESIGVPRISVDMSMPTLVPSVLLGLEMSPEVQTSLRSALDRKDAAAIDALKPSLGGEISEILAAMLAATGPADNALDALKNMNLPAPAQAERAALAKVVDNIRKGAPDLNITVDPVENRGFEYHVGVTFSLFSLDCRGELGRGGRYLAGNNEGPREPATGITLFMDTVLRTVPPRKSSKRVFLPAGTPPETAQKLRRENWITVCGLDEPDDPASRAIELGCSHIFKNGVAQEI